MLLDALGHLRLLCEHACQALDAPLAVGLTPEAGRLVSRAVHPAEDGALARLTPERWHLDPSRDEEPLRTLNEGRVLFAPLDAPLPLRGVERAALEAYAAERPQAGLLMVAVGDSVVVALMPRAADTRDQKFLAALGTQAALVREQMLALQMEHQVASRYRLIVENCPAGIALTDLDGTFRAANPALASIFGAEGPHQLLGRRAGEFYLNPDERQRFASNAIAEGVQRDSRHRGRRLDGTPMDMLLSAVLVRDAQGLPTGLVTFVRDITEERRRDAERQMLAEVVEASPHPVVIVETPGDTISYVNAAFCRLAGADTAGPLIGLTTVELGRQLAPDLDGLDIGELAQGGEAPLDLEITRPDGQLIPIEVKARAIRTAGREVLVAYVHDLTAQRQLQNRLVVSEKLTAVGLLVAGVAHELNNPLTTILGCSQLLLERGEGPPALLRSVERNALRCRTVVDGLLKFSRDYRPERVPLNLHALIDEAIDLRQADFDRGQVHLERRYDPALPEVSVDRHQMRQVFLNVVANSVQAMLARPSSRLLVRTERVPVTPPATLTRLTFVRVTFEDNGKGVPRHQLGRVFDPFFTTKEVGSGTGLGLSLALGVVQQHGGQIRFQSTEGRGTAVTIELPLESVPPLRPTAEPPVTSLLEG
jgi:PAS domain S-box-containing protein